MRHTNIEHWYKELYEDYPTERKEQLNKKEGEVIREIATLNKNIACRAKEDCFYENKEYNKKLLRAE
jgi:hypothetical protein